jgi:hypothetical protein
MLLAGSISIAVLACTRGLEEETFSVFDANTLTKPTNGEQAVRGTYAGLKDNGGYAIMPVTCTGLPNIRAMW